MINTLSLALCLFLCACHIPVLFWEEEALKVTEDVIQEEEKVLDSPRKSADKAKPPCCQKQDQKVKKVVLKRFAHEINIMNNDGVEIVTHHCSPDPFAPCP